MQLDEAAPYSAEFVVPREALGAVRAQAFGRGSLASAQESLVASNEIELLIRDTPAVLSIRADPEEVLGSDEHCGSTVLLFGMFADGIERELPVDEATVRVFNEGVAKISSGGKVVCLQPGSTTIQFRYGGQDVEVNVIVQDAPLHLNVRSADEQTTTLYLGPLISNQTVFAYGSRYSEPRPYFHSDCPDTELLLKEPELLTSYTSQAAGTEFVLLNVETSRFNDFDSIQAITSYCAVSKLLNH